MALHRDKTGAPLPPRCKHRWAFRSSLAKRTGHACLFLGWPTIMSPPPAQQSCTALAPSSMLTTNTLLNYLPQSLPGHKKSRKIKLQVCRDWLSTWNLKGYFPVRFISGFHTFKRVSLLTRNNPVPLPAPRDPHTPKQPVFHICIHLPQYSLFIENALICHSKISHAKIVPSWLRPAGPVIGSPAPSLPAVCPAHTSQTTASHNSFLSEVLLDLPLHYHAPNSSPNSV